MRKHYRRFHSGQPEQYPEPVGRNASRAFYRAFSSLGGRGKHVRHTAAVESLFRRVSIDMEPPLARLAPPLELGAGCDILLVLRNCDEAIFRISEHIPRLKDKTEN